MKPIGPRGVGRTLVLALALVNIAKGPAWSQGGSLTPPGAPTPGMLTLDQVEPRVPINTATVPGNGTHHHVILNPGSYFLEGNLDVTLTSGIRIAASGVTLDLRGFEIRRTAGAGGDGITIDDTATDATIRNGHIRGFGNGISTGPLFGATAPGSLIERIAVSECDFLGIESGQSSVVRDCRAFANSGTGFAIGDGSTIISCAAYNNQTVSGRGIDAGKGCVVMNCSAFNNSGTAAIEVDTGGTISGCAVYQNTVKYGIFALFGCTISDCIASTNTSAEDESYGIYGGSRCTIENCTASDTKNTGPAGAEASDNGAGILAFEACLIRHCLVTRNRGDGIHVRRTSYILENHCHSNGLTSGVGAGIRVLEHSNRIEGNSCLLNDIGINVDRVGFSTSNLIIRNSVRGGTPPYFIIAGNFVGTTVAAPASGAINGAAGGAGVGTTDPWGNISY